MTSLEIALAVTAIALIAIAIVTYKEICR